MNGVNAGQLQPLSKFIRVDDAYLSYDKYPREMFSQLFKRNSENCSCFYQ